MLWALCREHGVRSVHVNAEYGVNEQRRDQAVQAALQGSRAWPAQPASTSCSSPPGSVLTQSGGYFQVFSQFRKACYAELAAHLPTLRPLPAIQPPCAIASDPVPAAVDGFAAPGAGAAPALAGRRGRRPTGA